MHRTRSDRPNPVLFVVSTKLTVFAGLLSRCIHAGMHVLRVALELVCILYSCC